LLAYTGARLPSDTFELCPDLSDASAPLDLVVEIAGLNYHTDGDENIQEGDNIVFEKDPSNEFDPSAVKALHKGKCIGYINKALAPSFSRLIDSGLVSAEALKLIQSKGKSRLLVLVKYA
jgi:hypothetical protein